MQKFLSYYFIKWALLCVVVGVLTGSAVAAFLLGLDEVVEMNNNASWLIYFLPLGGIIIGLFYFYYGKEVEKGNNLILEEINENKQSIPFRMAPMVLLGTWLSHLFGASVGREGTAVQLGGAIADRFTIWFSLNHNDRKILLLLGISAGFAAVFGTPLAGAIFALEIMALGNLRWKAFLPSISVAYIAHFICLQWKVEHTEYFIYYLPEMNTLNFTWTAFAGVLFGLCAYLFVTSGDIFKQAFSFISFPPLRPFIGGTIVLAAIFLLDTNIYNSLGIQTIKNAFVQQQPLQVFFIKLLLTAFTLSAGFKGGEVTPLFFMGATLGSALILIIPLPLDYLAAIGFVSVFAGATNTPLACAVMGVELFGFDTGIFMIIACVSAYLSSGKKGIYASQISTWNSSK